MRRLKIIHRTYYNFFGAVQLRSHRLLLRPRDGHDVRIESSTLQTEPPATLRWLRDVYDNSVAIATFNATATQLAILSEVVVQHYGDRPLDFLVADYAVQYPFAYQPEEQVILQPYLMLQPKSGHDAVSAWVNQHWKSKESVQTYTLLQRLCGAINQSLVYKSREEEGVQTAMETLSLNSGSCRDFSNLFMEAARHLGLAVRFVSGYLDVPPTHSNFGATHAWAEVYLPGAGWKGFDPTLGEVVSNKHIAVAVARLPESVPPVAGSFVGPPGSTLNVGVWVTEL
jgi:transglutaminase-like putative cysteine protease